MSRMQECSFIPCVPRAFFLLFDFITYPFSRPSAAAESSSHQHRRSHAQKPEILSATNYPQSVQVLNYEASLIEQQVCFYFSNFFFSYERKFIIDRTITRPSYR